MSKIKIGIVGVGNCASALLQGIEYYRAHMDRETIGLLHWNMNGYMPVDIVVVSAFDIDRRKVGKDVHEAIYSLPNCTPNIMDHMPVAGVKVFMGRINDGFSEHMKAYEDDQTFILSDETEPEKEEVVDILLRSGTEILLNYLPVGSEEATRFYAQCALDAGVAFVNNIPVFIASNPIWAQKFKSKNIPLIGDDIKSQLGATIVHRTLTRLFENRGVKIDRTYQMNTGGNTDFLNMTDKDRLKSKKISKTQAVQSVMHEALSSRNIHIGPSDYIPWLGDNKIGFIRIEGRIFGNVPMNLELRLSVIDSPNSAGVAIDCIRLCRLALDRHIGGVLEAPSAYFCKHPPVQFADDVAYERLKSYITDELSTTKAGHDADFIHSSR